MHIEDHGPFLLFLQYAYIKQIIESAGMNTETESPLSMGNLMSEAKKPLLPREKETIERKPYRENFRSLLYLCERTRTDIATAVSLLGTFNETTAPRNWNKMKFVILYLIGTVNFGIMIEKGSEKSSMEVYLDADWGRNEEKRKSRSGFLIT